MTTKKPSKKKSKVNFSVSEDRQPIMNTGEMASRMREMMGAKEDLAKSVEPNVIKTDLKGKYEKSKITFSSREYSEISENVWTKGWRRVSDAEQRELVQLDPYIGAIISTRVSQASCCGTASESKFDKGTRIIDLNAPKENDYDTKQEYEKACEIREAQSNSILKWALSCGTTNEDVLNVAFEGEDPTFKKCKLRDFIEAQTRNLLSFGRAGTQILRNQDGIPVFFRPLPIETIHNVVPGENTSIGKARNTAEQSLEDLKEYNEIDSEEKPTAYVQRIDGANVNFFTEDDCHIWHWQRQALWGLNGYPLSPIEMTVYMIFIHQQTLSYLRNQFVKGLMSKGALVLESTDPSVELSDADLEALRMQFHNFASRNDNSAVLPVISGPIKANFISLSNSPKDLEFLKVEESIIRALCSAFQISPHEMGYGHLSTGEGGITQANKQEDIIRGEERGLRQILDIIYEGVNEILYLNFPEARENFKISYVGVGEDTRDAVLQRQQAEINTTATMDSLYSDSEKTDKIGMGGSVPLAPIFHQNVVRYMKYWEFRYHFFGDESAKDNPAYNFIIDPNLNTAYQQLVVQTVKDQKKAAEIQNQMMLQQAQSQQQQSQMQAQGQLPPGQAEQQAPEEQPSEEQPEETQKSEEPITLRKKWLEINGLKKSTGKYFSAWLDNHFIK